MLTLYLGDRKSETYTMQWKYIDFSKHTVRLKHALDKYQRKTHTKGRKDTVIHAPEVILILLREWESAQAEQLLKLKIIQTLDQYLFTYSKPSGEVNCPVHADILNYRINAIKKDILNWLNYLHTSFAIPMQLQLGKVEPHMNQISNALTHSDISTTKIYVNTPDVIDKSVFEVFRKGLNSCD